MDETPGSSAFTVKISWIYKRHGDVDYIAYARFRMGDDRFIPVILVDLFEPMTLNDALDECEEYLEEEYRSKFGKIVDHGAYDNWLMGRQKDNVWKQGFESGILERRHCTESDRVPWVFKTMHWDTSDYSILIDHLGEHGADSWKEISGPVSDIQRLIEYSKSKLPLEENERTDAINILQEIEDNSTWKDRNDGICDNLGIWILNNKKED